MGKVMAWSEALSVGDPELDEQHRTLIEMFNTLFSFLNRGESKDKIGPLLSDLNSYTRLHFRNEERHIGLIAHVNMEKHFQEHLQMEKQIEVYQEIFARNDSDLTYEMIGFLRDWILRHIMHTDIEYKQKP